MFLPEHDLKRIRPASYNPREISAEAFEKLRYSVRTLGVIKPIIVGKNGVILAGHQRTKAMQAEGITSCPAFLLDHRVTLQDEVRFNLYHNRVEAGDDRAYLTGTLQVDSFNWVQPENIHVKDFRDGCITTKIGLMLFNHGDFGSAVCDPDGKIIENSNVATVYHLVGRPLLVYCLSWAKVEIYREILRTEFGVYNYDRLDVKSRNQLELQPKRIAGEDRHSSRLFKTFVKPYFQQPSNRHERAVDFGAGRGVHARELQSMGIACEYYEPHYVVKGSLDIDVKEVVLQIARIWRDVQKNGLYDVVICDSVMNAVVDTRFEHYVMATCNALMKPGGRFFVTCRPWRKEPGQIAKFAKLTMDTCDKNGVTGRFRNGHWTKLRYHGTEQFMQLARRYFRRVEVLQRKTGQTMFQCRGKIDLGGQVYAEVLDVEFNMELPGGRFHNRHRNLVDELLRRNDGTDEPRR